jgi:phage terminase large subunit
MYDDYDLDYTFCNDYNLDEDSYYEHSTLDADLDEDYARDGQDYESLAYRHYA